MQPTAQAVGVGLDNMKSGISPEGGERKLPRRTVYPFKCGNNSLKADDEDDRINS
jgi:hypothetical protein